MTTEPPIYVDATTMYRWRDLAPVGIVRLERLLVAHLRFEASIAPVHYVLWDGGYRPADDDESARLDQILRESKAAATHRSRAPIDADPILRRRGVKPTLRRAGLRLIERFPDHLRPFAEQAAWSSATLAVESARHLRRARADRRHQAAIPQRPAQGVVHRVDFSAGGDLVALGLGWEYLDHEAMYVLRRDHGIRIHMPAFDLIPIDMPQLNSGQSHLVHRYYAEMAHYADTITSISEATTNALRRFYSEEELPCSVLETNPLPGFDPPLRSEDQPGRRRHRYADEAFVLTVSTIEIRKNHLLLARLWAECIREGRTMPKLVIVGRIGWDVGELMRWVEHAPELRGNIDLAQDVDDDELVALYQDCLFTVFPSRIEGWGLPITESLTHGKVCVHSTDPAQFEASQGLMPAHHPDDHMSWKREILQLIEDEHYRLNLERKIADSYVPRTPAEYVQRFARIIASRRSEAT